MENGYKKYDDYVRLHTVAKGEKWTPTQLAWQLKDQVTSAAVEAYCEEKETDKGRGAAKPKAKPKAASAGKPAKQPDGKPKFGSVKSTAEEDDEFEEDDSLRF